MFKFLTKKLIEHFVYDRKQQTQSLILLTMIIAPSLSFFLEKGGADPWQLVILCFVLSTLLLAIPKDHGDTFSTIGFKMSFTGILLVIAFGLFNTSLQNLSVRQTASNGIFALFGLLLLLTAIIMLSWSMGEIFLESARKMRVHKASQL